MFCVFTIYAFAIFCALETCIEALTVFFLAVTFAAVACSRCTWFYPLLCLHYLFCTSNWWFMLLTVVASFAIALVCAHFSCRETFAIHFQTFSLLAGASSLSFFDSRSWVDLVLLEMFLEWEFWGLKGLDLLGSI